MKIQKVIDMMKAMHSPSATMEKADLEMKFQRVTEVAMENLGFICVGQMCEFPDHADEDPNVYLWLNRCGTWVTMYDDEDGTMSLVEIIRYVQEEKKDGDVRNKAS